MTLEQLIAFVAVVDGGTLTRAAEDLGLSQSTLSFRLKSLEESLGSRLLDRGRRAVGTTPAGARLLPIARQILDLAVQAKRDLTEELEPVGQVVVAASTVPAEYLLPKRLARFRKCFPLVSLVVRVKDSREATRALLDGSCDLAIVGAESGDRRRLHTTPFAVDDIVLVGPPDMLSSRAFSPADLEERPWVRREMGSGTRRAVDELLRGLGCRADGDVEVTSTEAVRRCVLAGMGVAFVSLAAVQEDVLHGKLMLLDFPGTPLSRTFHLQRLKGRSIPTPAEVLWSALASEKTVL
jgi:DNA-binding transcriptional LysR family regulator